MNRLTQLTGWSAVGAALVYGVLTAVSGCSNLGPPSAASPMFTDAGLYWCENGSDGIPRCVRASQKALEVLGKE